jgi:hypothetical protein
MSTVMTSSPISCPSCTTPGTGRFCGSCGTPLIKAHCTACGRPLAPGARFCSNCRESPTVSPLRVASPPARSVEWVPWMMTGVALVLIAFVVGQRVGGATRVSVITPRQSLAVGVASSAPDISLLSPRERVDRLYDRIMRLDAEGKRDSVNFFANMAIPGYGQLPLLDDDLRYDLGRIEEVAGALVLARAQADTILLTTPAHLLGLALGMRTAYSLGDTTGARALGARLLAAERTERKKALPEYERHAADIADAEKEARKAK